MWSFGVDVAADSTASPLRHPPAVLSKSTASARAGAEEIDADSGPARPSYLIDIDPVPPPLARLVAPGEDR